MSREAVHTLLELAPHLDLTHLEFRVAIYLADRLNTTTGQLNPSPERMARDCGLDPASGERSVRRVLDRLAAKGLVSRTGSTRGGRQEGGRPATQHYRLYLPPENPAPVNTKAAGQRLNKGPESAGNPPVVASSNGKGDIRAANPDMRSGNPDMRSTLTPMPVS